MHIKFWRYNILIEGTKVPVLCVSAGAQNCCALMGRQEKWSRNWPPSPSSLPRRTPWSQLIDVCLSPSHVPVPIYLPLVQSISASTLNTSNDSAFTACWDRKFLIFTTHCQKKFLNTSVLNNQPVTCSYSHGLRFSHSWRQVLSF